jgi:hypothetical protein
MAAKRDLQHGITADLTVSHEDAVAACRRACETFGEFARFQSNGNKASVTLVLRSLGGRLVGSKSGRPMVVGVSLDDSNGRVHLNTNVEKYVTSQSKVFGFIPAGPKMLWGREAYFKFLDALENELRAVDPAGDIMRRRP